jgi:hypothetical protein
MKNGTTYPTSRNRVLIVVNHRPNPNAVMRVKIKKTGKNIMCQEGKYPYHTIIPPRIKEAKKKSARGAKIPLIGIMSRGK